MDHVNNSPINRSSSVSVALESEPQLEDSVVELAFVAELVVDFPLSVDYLESDVFIGGSCMEADRRKVDVLAGGHREGWGYRVVQQVIVEHLQAFNILPSLLLLHYSVAFFSFQSSQICYDFMDSSHK